MSGADVPPGPEPDWTGVIEAARSEAVLPLVYAWLRRSPERMARAAAVIDAARAGSARIAARHLELAHALAALLEALGDRGIPCAPLRGPALAERLYGTSATRAMGDLDVLVRKCDLGRVRELLVARGFSEIDRRPGFAAAYSYTLELYTGGPPPLIVEPHWTIAYPPLTDAIDMEAVWSRCAPAMVLGVPALSLSSEDGLLHLALHLAHADRTPLLWPYEIDRFVRQAAPPLDWGRFVAIARAGRASEPVACALRRVRSLFDTPVPPDVLRALDDRHARPSPRWAERVAETAVDGRESLAVLFALPGARARLRFAISVLLPTRAFMQGRYGTVGPVALARAYLGRVTRFAILAVRALLLAATAALGPRAGR